MTLFEELFGDMGPAYTAIAHAHLQIKADAGAETARMLLAPTGGGIPAPGDAIWQEDTLWVYDAGEDATEWFWWSPAQRATWPKGGRPDGTPLVARGQLVAQAAPPAGVLTPEAQREALKLLNAVQWMFGEYVVAEEETNPKTGAKFLKRVDIGDAEELLDAYDKDPAVTLDDDDE